MVSSKQNSRRGLVFLVSFVVLAAVSFGIFWFLTADSRKFQKGLQELEAGNYTLAIAIFEALPDHEKAPEKLLDARYRLGLDLKENKQYAQAAEVFSQIPAYLNSTEQAQSCHYQLGNAARLKKDYETARSHYALAGDYSDASLQQQRMIYTMGHNAFLEADYDAAIALFDQLDGDQSDYGNPHFQTLGDAVSYLDAHRLNLSDRITFHYDVKADPEFYETLRNIFPCEYYYANYYAPDKLVTIAGIHYYPGENILWAVKNQDTSRLTEEELAVLELAEQVVTQAQAESTTPYETELWLHDWLCARVDYESPDMDIRRNDYIQLRELTCVGAMLDGIANCQGYADSFYLLGNMAGLEVGRVLGDTGGGHIWNTIRLDDQLYIVDVTFDDLSDQEQSGWCYTYFNTFWDPEVYDPYGDDHAAPAVTAEEDLQYSYFSQNDLIFSELDEAVDSLVSQYVEEDQNWTYALLEGYGVDHDDLDEAIRNKLWKYARHDRMFSWVQWLDCYGGNTYLVINWQ